VKKCVGILVVLMFLLSASVVLGVPITEGLFEGWESTPIGKYTFSTDKPVIIEGDMCTWVAFDTAASLHEECEGLNNIEVIETNQGKYLRLVSRHDETLGNKYHYKENVNIGSIESFEDFVLTRDSSISFEARTDIDWSVIDVDYPLSPIKFGVRIKGKVEGREKTYAIAYWFLPDPAWEIRGKGDWWGRRTRGYIILPGPGPKYQRNFVEDFMERYPYLKLDGAVLSFIYFELQTAGYLELDNICIE